MTERGYPDSLGMWDAAAARPEELMAAFDAAKLSFGDPARLPGRDTVQTVVAVGVGTGRTAAEAVVALAVPQLSVPFWVGSGPHIPAFVDRHSLCFAVTAGGDDEDTAAAAAAAVARGATVIVVGGTADAAPARLAADAGLVWCPGAATGGPPRAALAGATVPLLVALVAVGLLPDCAPSLTAAASALRRRRDAVLASGGPAETLAQHLGRTIPVVYGNAGAAAVAAGWWKACINLNAKAPAFASELGAATSAELAGWGQGGDITRQAMTLVLLRHRGEDVATAARFDAVWAATDEVMADVLTVWAEGEDDLARFFDLALLGEVVSLHLARREGVDPGPVPAVDAVSPLVEPT